MHLLPTFILLTLASRLNLTPAVVLQKLGFLVLIIAVLNCFWVPQHEVIQQCHHVVSAFSLSVSQFYDPSHNDVQMKLRAAPCIRPKM